MANSLKPRRGIKSTAEAQLVDAHILGRGELFFEVPNTGVGTGAGKIKMGDGKSDYEDLPYFLEGGGGGTGAGLTYKGTISSISSLDIANAEVGDLYYCTAKFTTTSDFIQGNNVNFGPCNIICISNNNTLKWNAIGVPVDPSMSTSSNNPVQNSAVTTKINSIENIIKVQTNDPGSGTSVPAGTQLIVVVS